MRFPGCPNFFPLFRLLFYLAQLMNELNTIPFVFRRWSLWLLVEICQGERGRAVIAILAGGPLITASSRAVLNREKNIPSPAQM